MESELKHRRKPRSPAIADKVRAHDGAVVLDAYCDQLVLSPGAARQLAQRLNSLADEIER